MPRAPRPPSQALVCVSSPSTVTDEWALVGARTCRHQLPGAGPGLAPVRDARFLLHRRRAACAGETGVIAARLTIGSAGIFSADAPGTRPLREPAVLAAKAARLRAALRSRSRTSPHASHRNTRVRSGSLAFTTPQPEQVLLEGYQRSASTSRRPFHVVL